MFKCLKVKTLMLLQNHVLVPVCFFSKTIKLKIHRHMLSGVFLIYKDGTVPVVFSNCKTVTDA